MSRALDLGRLLLFFRWSRDHKLLGFDRYRLVVTDSKRDETKEITKEQQQSA